jgi:hypothetical protein
MLLTSTYKRISNGSVWFPLQSVVKSYIPESYQILNTLIPPSQGPKNFQMVSHQPKIKEFLIPMDQSISINKFLTSTCHGYKRFSDSKWFWMIWFPTEDGPHFRSTKNKKHSKRRILFVLDALDGKTSRDISRF